MNELNKHPLTAKWFGRAILCVASLAATAHAQTLENALDQTPGLTFSTVTYDYETALPLPGIEWFGQAGIHHDGVDAAQVSGLPKGSWSRLDAVVEGPATISWWWKASTGHFLERLGFISNESDFYVDGDVDWQQRTVEIGCGEQVISWYLNISDLSQGTDGVNAGFLDEIVFTPKPNVPAIQAGLDNATVDFYSDDWIQGSYNGIPGAENGMVAKSGPVAEGRASSMFFCVEGPVEISFDWGVESDPNASNSSFGFTVDGQLKDQIFGSTTLSSQAFEFGPGLHSMSFRYYRDYAYQIDPDNPEIYEGETNGFVDNMVITQIPASAALADAVDVAPKVFGKKWNRQTQVSHDGSDAACVSGLAVGDSEELFVELPDDAGLLSLWIKLSTETNAGYLDVEVDGGLVGSATGEQGWRKIVANLEQGFGRILKITYVRERVGAGDIGTNTAYVDQITLQPGVTNFQPDLSIKAPKSRRYAGRYRYNRSGVGQLTKYKAKRRRPFGKFKLNVQNLCPTDSDEVSFYGTRSNRNFEIYYIVKFQGKVYNITAEFRTGQFSTETLGYLESEPYEVWIVARDGYRKLVQTARVLAISKSDGSKVDTVKARLKILRR